jgi:glycosyltransferase involved in cell wall biosynthesis
LPSPRLLIVSLGRRGALVRLALNLLEAARQEQGSVHLLVSGQSELSDAFAREPALATALDTFDSAAAGAWRLDRIAAARRALVEAANRHRSEAVVSLMPHVWSPLMGGAIRRARLFHASIVHDAAPHAGDRTGLVHAWLMREADQADLVLALSRHVRDRLVEPGRVAPERIETLFLPDLVYAAPPAPARAPGSPLRVLFFGRILAYKGLPLLIAAAERLRNEGLRIELGVFGEGALGTEAERLRALGAEVENHWIAEEEVGPILARYDVMALPYVAASQSGVAAAALGSGLPLVATPVGGLAEQVRPGETGLLSERADADSFALALRRLATEPGLLDRLRAGASRDRDARSFPAFLRALREAIAPRLPARR